MIVQLRSRTQESKWSEWETIDTKETGLLDQYAIERIFERNDAVNVVIKYKEIMQEWRRPSMKKHYDILQIVHPNAAPEKIGELPYDEQGRLSVESYDHSKGWSDLIVPNGSYVIKLVEEPDV